MTFFYINDNTFRIADNLLIGILLA